MQLEQRDALTGSYPSISRLASDNRSGVYDVNFNDNFTVNFTSINQATTLAGPPRKLGLEYNPIALYKFDGDIKDNSGNGFDLSVHSGSLQFANGPFVNSRAVFFDGFNSLSSSIESALQITGPVTIEAVFKPSIIETPALPAFGNFIASVGGVGETLDTNVLYSLVINLSNKTGSVGFDLERSTGADYMGSTAADTIEANRWYHLAVARNSSEQSTVYLNGENLGTFSHAGFPEKAGAGNVQKLFVGTQPTGGGNYQQLAFKGWVATLKIIDRELSQEEILEEYERVFPEGILGGTGFPIGSPWTINRTANDLPTTKSIAIPGPVRSQAIEGQSYFHFTPGQNLKPFKENDNPALDGLASTSSFYAVGSPINQVGEGFDQPLWSKSKIEINLPVSPGTAPNTIQTFVSGGYNTVTNPDPASGSVQKTEGGPVTSNGFGNVGLSYPMAYYNFDAERWEGIGRGEALCYNASFRGKTGVDRVSPFPYTATVGFSQGLVTQREGVLDPGVSGAFEYMAGAGQPISNFGFPFDARYHATSSQTLKVSNLINEPFVVEKIVVDFSGAFAFSSTNFTTETIVRTSTINPNTVISAAFPAAINNFFMLVQRKPFSYNVSLPIEARQGFNSVQSDIFLDAKLPTAVTLSNAAGATQVNTIREVLTFGGVSSLAANAPTNVFREGNVGDGLIINALPATENPKKLMTRDVVFQSTADMLNDLTALNWSGSFRMEVGSRNPTQVEELFGINESGNAVLVAIGWADTKNDFGGRNGLGVTRPGGRDLISPIAAIDVLARADNNRTIKEVILANSASHYRFGGYILKPGDELVFGWQQPIPMTLTEGFQSRHVNDGILSTMTFKGAKVTIYGSLLREGKEFHDTLNQLLTSEGVHEVIE